MTVLEFFLVFSLDDSMGLGEVEVLSEIMDVQLSDRIGFIIFSNIRRTIIGGNLDDFIQSDLINVLIFLIDLSY